MTRDYRIMDGNKMTGYLNERLAFRQNITDEQLAKLKELHIVKDFVFGLMEKTDDPVQLKAGADLVEQLEFALQRNWNFDEDAGMHEWYNVPGCLCPKLDNMDSRYPGSTHRIHTQDCPIHGFDVSEEFGG